METDDRSKGDGLQTKKRRGFHGGSSAARGFSGKGDHRRRSQGVLPLLLERLDTVDVSEV